MRLHHPYLDGGDGSIDKNHMDKCQQDMLIYQMSARQADVSDVSKTG